MSADDLLDHLAIFGRQAILDLVSLSPAGQDAGPPEILQGMRGIGSPQGEALDHIRDTELFVAGREHYAVLSPLCRQYLQEIQGARHGVSLAASPGVRFPVICSNPPPPRVQSPLRRMG